MALFLMQTASADDLIQVENAWIREAPPTIKTMAGYLEIKNNSENERILVKAESDDFEYIEFHLSEIKDGIARMKKQENIIIPPHSTFTFKPESYHLMLFNNKTMMRAGVEVPMTLVFADGEEFVVKTRIKKGNSRQHNDGRDHSNEHHHHH